MNAVTKALIETIGAAGFDVQIGKARGNPAIEAVNRDTGERFVVRGDSLYAALVELAAQVGIELEDG